MSYRYYSLRLDGGDEAVGRVTEALATRFAEANLDLPPAMRAADVGFAVIASVTSEERQRVQRSLGPAVTALELFAAASGASSLVIIVLGALRVILETSGRHGSGTTSEWSEPPGRRPSPFPSWWHRSPAW
jgi:hypothetical protein